MSDPRQMTNRLLELVEEGVSTMRLRVSHVEILGADTLVHGHLGEDKMVVTVRLPDVRHLERNAILPLAVSSRKLHLFDPETGNRLGD